MDTMDEFQTGPVEGLLAVELKDVEINMLKPHELAILNSFVQSPAYRVWQKLCESIIERTETAHFRTWQNPELFTRTGLISVAQRMFYEKVQAESAKQVKEFLDDAELVKTKQQLLKTPLEDQIRDELLR